MWGWTVGVGSTAEVCMVGMLRCCVLCTAWGAPWCIYLLLGDLCIGVNLTVVCLCMLGCKLASYL